jgi:hypothetical protein
MDDEQEADALHMAAVVDGEVVAYGRLSGLDGDTYQISQMVVTPSHQGTGVGRRILTALIREAVASGATTVTLKARLSAEGFYAGAGFRRCGEPFPSGKTTIPHVGMELGAGAFNEALAGVRQCRKK